MSVLVRTALLLVVGCVLARALTRCEYRNYLGPQQIYYIFSPGYPFNYTTDIECRWTLNSPPGYVCRLNCSQFVMTPSPACSADRLVVSNRGDPLLMNANVYCDRRAFTEVSIGPRITLGLLTQQGTSGGRFFCEVTAERANLFYSLSAPTPDFNAPRDYQ